MPKHECASTECITFRMVGGWVGGEEEIEEEEEEEEKEGCEVCI